MASSSSAFNPGPDDTSLLSLQSTHVSEHIWNGADDRVIICRRACKVKSFNDNLHDEVKGYLRSAGFYGIARVGYWPVDHHLISALIERWRPETHTFHMPGGECTVTLQDVAIQLGLPIDGRPLIGRTDLDWRALVQNLLGKNPPDQRMHGGRIEMFWLDEQFKDTNLNTCGELVRQQWTRAYILRLIGGVLFADHSSRYVHLMWLQFLENLQEAGTYSWGSACLAYLYRELCKATDYDRVEMGGVAFLLQFWAWDRFPTIAPELITQQNRGPDTPLCRRWGGFKSYLKAPMHSLTYYRYKLERMRLHEIVWEPYNAAVIATLPNWCLAGSDIWRAVVPMICGHIVEWHQPDRVMRQFGYDQHIPTAPLQLDHLHSITLQGRWETDWLAEHRPYVELWERRRELVMVGDPIGEPLNRHSEYMQWYSKRTRRWITPDGMRSGQLVSRIEKLYQYALNAEQFSTLTIDTLRDETEECLKIIEEQDQVNTPRDDHPAPPMSRNIPRPPETEAGRRAREQGRGLAQRRRRLDNPDQPPPFSQPFYQTQYAHQTQAPPFYQTPPPNQTPYFVPCMPMGSPAYVPSPYYIPSPPPQMPSPSQSVPASPMSWSPSQLRDLAVFSPEHFLSPFYATSPQAPSPSQQPSRSTAYEEEDDDD